MSQAFPNIEKSAFHPGEYVGYAAGLLFRIRKNGREWVAHCSKTQTRRAAPTLSLLSVALENVIPQIEDPRIDGFNPEFLGAKPAKAGEDY